MGRTFTKREERVACGIDPIDHDAEVEDAVEAAAENVLRIGMELNWPLGVSGGYPAVCARPRARFVAYDGKVRGLSAASDPSGS